MPNKRFSDLVAPSSLGSVWVPGYDLTRSPGDQNVKFSMASLIAANGGSGDAPVVTNVTGIVVAVGDAVNLQLHTPLLTTTDIAILGLTFKAPTIGAPLYRLRLYQGPVPSDLDDYSNLLFDSDLVGLGENIGDDMEKTWSYPITIFLSASSGSNQLWARINNRDFNVVKLSAQTITLEFESGAAELPEYVDPPPYTGPLMNEVFVGPSQQFSEPRYALCALADGGTMHIDSGMYYLPFGLTWDRNDATKKFDRRFGYNPNHPDGACRFQQGITILGAGTYTTTPTIFNGRGGYGLKPNHPSNLLYRNGFVRTESPLNISGIRFIYCGGLDCNSDGEAAIYVLNGDTTKPVIINIDRCAFDANENGIFTQYWYGRGHPGETDISNATGNCRTVTVNITNSDFGFIWPNGYAGDGFGHDFYINCMTLNIDHCHHYCTVENWASWNLCPPLRSFNNSISEQAGNTLIIPITSGNLLKGRCRYMNVSNGYMRSQAGKWIDRPEGGSLHVTNCDFVTLEVSTTVVLAYNTENGTYQQPTENPIFQNCRFYMGRTEGFGNIFWIGGDPGQPLRQWDFSDPTNQLIFLNSSACFVINRTSSQFAQDASAFVGFVGQYEIGPDGNMVAGTVGTKAYPPNAPPPASLLPGETVDENLKPFTPP